MERTGMLIKKHQRKVNRGENVKQNRENQERIKVKRVKIRKGDRNEVHDEKQTSKKESVK
jgi:hypothetical protein